MKLVETGGDIAAAAAAFAGLVLVFLGAAIGGIEGYGATGRDAVIWRYRRRAWPAFFALLSALAACFVGLLGKASEYPPLIWWAGGLLAASALGIVFAAAQLLSEVG